ncbi:MAG TPA: nucleotidyltransferase domain-containing protein [Tepidisphaeraceae bacterium]|jgi:predicted nucleotidyltransferase|nr:nucleotidyltransferase domain-containing protein [Tepidisphaeraceae bacterium]
MVAPAIEKVVRDYLRAATSLGIPARRAMLFRSQARGDTHEWSDIDLIILSPALEPPRSNEIVKKLWRLCPQTDARIEPIPCGEIEWQTDNSRVVLEIARQEGVVIEV